MPTHLPADRWQVKTHLCSLWFHSWEDESLSPLQHRHSRLRCISVVFTSSTFAKVKVGATPLFHMMRRRRKQYPFQVFLLCALSCKTICLHLAVPENILWDLWKDKGCLFCTVTAQFCYVGSNKKLCLWCSHTTCCVRTVSISCIVWMLLFWMKCLIGISTVWWTHLSGSFSAPVWYFDMELICHAFPLRLVRVQVSALNLLM